jgi:two-component system CitB family sensor kinase
MGTRTLASQLLLGVLGILVVTTSLGGFLYVKLSGRTLDQQYEQRALTVANAVAALPEIRQALPAGDPHHAIQPLAEQIRHRTGAAYVVVMDRTGLRYSHTRPAEIGQRVEEPVVALDGRGHTGIDPGSLGRSANGRAPVFGAGGAVVGEVSVGILETEVSDRQHAELLAIALYSALALGLGVAASWLLAHRVKRVTFGLEVPELAALLQEREAMLHGIREGVIGIDAKGRVNVINAEAQRLLRLGPAVTGRPVPELVPPGRLRDLLTGAVDGTDGVALTDEFLLVLNRMPVALGGRDIGSVVTVRDRTEMEALIRELRSVSGLTAALRAQEHEYANRLHVLAGLLELGEHQEATGYLADISRTSLGRAEELRARVAPPVVAALLLAKITVAAEQGVRLVVAADSRLEASDVDPHTLLTIVGNLVDNAVDALAGRPEPRDITVHLDDRDGVRIVVEDTGPGIATAEVADIFRDGYSTKNARGGRRRGLGLALVHRIVRRAGGTIEVTPGAGARFEIRLPATAPAATGAPR